MTGWASKPAEGQALSWCVQCWQPEPERENAPEPGGESTSSPVSLQHPLLTNLTSVDQKEIFLSHKAR